MHTLCMVFRAICKRSGLFWGMGRPSDRWEARPKVLQEFHRIYILPALKRPGLRGGDKDQLTAFKWQVLLLRTAKDTIELLT
jgi:hypothetical protein